VFDFFVTESLVVAVGLQKTTSQPKDSKCILFHIVFFIKIALNLVQNGYNLMF